MDGVFPTTSERKIRRSFSVPFSSLDIPRFYLTFAPGRSFLNLFATGSSLAHIRSHFFVKKSPYLCTPHRGVEQSVARRAHNPEVVGSSPSSATTEDKSKDLSSFLFMSE